VFLRARICDSASYFDFNHARAKVLEQNGLVATFRKKAPGNDRKRVNLSDLSVEVLSSYFKWDKSAPPQKSLSNDEYIDSTLQLLKLDDEMRRVAARELVDISRAYIIPSNSSLFVYLEESLKKK
jgi:hypothetical protein